MAKNEVFERGNNLALTCSDPTTPASGDPVRYGELIGVAQTAEGSDGVTTVKFDGVHLLSVKGVDGGGNSAVAVGDKIYYVDADTPKLSKKATGRLAGHAVEAKANGTTYAGTITSGSTATIPVRLVGV
jgi:predicted RecA/RadA family phage recombinase